MESYQKFKESVEKKQSSKFPDFIPVPVESTGDDVLDRILKQSDDDYLTMMCSVFELRFWTG